MKIRGTWGQKKGVIRIPWTQQGVQVPNNAAEAVATKPEQPSLKSGRGPCVSMRLPVEITLGTVSGGSEVYMASTVLINQRGARFECSLPPERLKFREAPFKPHLELRIEVVSTGKAAQGKVNWTDSWPCRDASFEFTAELENPAYLFDIDFGLANRTEQKIADQVSSPLDQIMQISSGILDNTIQAENRPQPDGGLELPIEQDPASILFDVDEALQEWQKSESAEQTDFVSASRIPTSPENLGIEPAVQTYQEKPVAGDAVSVSHPMEISLEASYFTAPLPDDIQESNGGPSAAADASRESTDSGVAAADAPTNATPPAHSSLRVADLNVPGTPVATTPAHPNVPGTPVWGDPGVSTPTGAAPAGYPGVLASHPETRTIEEARMSSAVQPAEAVKPLASAIQEDGYLETLVEKAGDRIEQKQQAALSSLEEQAQKLLSAQTAMLECRAENLVGENQQMIVEGLRRFTEAGEQTARRIQQETEIGLAALENKGKKIAEESAAIRDQILKECRTQIEQFFSAALEGTRQTLSNQIDEMTLKMAERIQKIFADSVDQLEQRTATTLALASTGLEEQMAKSAQVVERILIQNAVKELTAKQKETMEKVRQQIAMATQQNLATLRGGLADLFQALTEASRISKPAIS